MKRSFLLLILLGSVSAQPSNGVQDKNFFLLSAIERAPEVAALLRSDPALARLGASKRESLNRAVQSCKLDLDCFAAALEWSESDAAAAAGNLRDLYRSSGAVKRLVQVSLRPSRMFQRYQDASGDDLLSRAWLDAVRGIDNIIDVYGLGHAPRYPQIDAVAYDVKSDSYRNVVRKIVETVQDQESKSDLFFDPALRFALYLLEANGRDEAARLEPLEKGENAACIARIPSISWRRFPYSVIVVPGAGPDRPAVNLSPSGKMRLILAAKRFREGKAPIILVSGGYVHPVQTPFSEAVEMKKYLIGKLGVSAGAILIDPQARHTTTNLRNAARQIYRYGIPFDKVALITTDTDQSRYIEGSVFADRCMKELGYKPYQLGARISPFDLEWRPVIDSLQADSRDPLDP